MKNRFYLTLTLLTIVMLAFLPTSFAQEGVIIAPEEGEFLDEEVMQESVEVNASSAYVVQLVYLLPNDREAQSDIDAKLDALIKETQQFFADEMVRHGFSRKTFRFEADENGNAIVHHIESEQNDEFFQEWTGDSRAIRDYFGDRLNLEKYIYLVAIDVSAEKLGAIEACGFWGGIAWIPASGECFTFSVVAHELGHGFGLTHNFNDNTYVLSYGSDSDALSACAAEWLDVNPYFNPDKVITPNKNTSIKLISNTFDRSPPYAQRLRFEINDPDKLHQAQLITAGENYAQYVDCRSLSGKRDIVQFTIIEELNSVAIRVIDKDGNYVSRGFKISGINIPSTRAVTIPDANLARALRSALGYAPAEQITKFDMSRLQELSAHNRNIKDLTGLQHAAGLKLLRLGYNQISDISPLKALTQLTYLNLNHNQISDITPLKNMTRLENLNLQHNRISDILPLKKLVRLRSLYIDNNNLIEDITALEDMTNMRYLQLPSPLITNIAPLTRMTKLIELYAANGKIRDVKPLAGMTQLESLTLFNNPITDITPLTRLTQLVELWLSECQISDITPLAGMTQLKSLGLSNNQIIDIKPLTRLTKLEELSLVGNQISDVRQLIGLEKLIALWIWGNPITDRGPLLTLLRRNPGIKIYHKKGGEPLPVTLSSFKAVHTVDGAVVNWRTESELNNAGFNIYRSDTQNGGFRQVNTKLIKGAGTTGERSTYTWTDTTAKPNTVYYYQIEDVSYAGVHKTLATTRLRGLVSAKGKLVTQWADFKSLR